MRRAGRIIYNGAMALSLLLCLGTVGVWVRSYWVSDTLSWYDWPKDQSCYNKKTICSSRGGLRFTSSKYCGADWPFGGRRGFIRASETAAGYPLFATAYYPGMPVEYRDYAALGFELVPDAMWRQRGLFEASFTASSLTLPIYFPCLLLALLPAHYFLRVRRRRRVAKRRARGCCVFCGYDLRASAGRCPECGRSSGEVLRPGQA